MIQRSALSFSRLAECITLGMCFSALNVLNEACAQSPFNNRLERRRSEVIEGIAPDNIGGTISEFVSGARQ